MVKMVSMDGKTTLDVPPEMFEPDGVRAPQSNPDDITPAMVEAGMHEFDRAFSTESSLSHSKLRDLTVSIYRAMRAAAR